MPLPIKIEVRRREEEEEVPRADICFRISAVGNPTFNFVAGEQYLKWNGNETKPGGSVEIPVGTRIYPSVRIKNTGGVGADCRIRVDNVDTEENVFYAIEYIAKNGELNYKNAGYFVMPAHAIEVTIRACYNDGTVDCIHDNTATFTLNVAKEPKACFLAVDFYYDNVPSSLEILVGEAVNLASGCMNCGGAEGNIHTTTYVDGALCAEAFKSLPVGTANDIARDPDTYSITASCATFDMPNRAVKVDRYGEHWDGSKWVEDFHISFMLTPKGVAPPPPPTPGDAKAVILSKSPTTDRNYVISDTIDVELELINRGEGRGEIKGIVKKDGFIFTSCEGSADVGEKISTKKSFVMPATTVALDFFTYHKYDFGWQEGYDEHESVLLTPVAKGVPKWGLVGNPVWEGDIVRIDLSVLNPRIGTHAGSNRYTYRGYLILDGRPAIRSHDMEYGGDTTGVFLISKDRLDDLGYTATIKLREFDYKEDTKTWIDEVTKIIPPQPTLPYTINITVNDENGNPIEGAYVDIDQWVDPISRNEKKCTDSDVTVYEGECRAEEWEGDGYNVVTTSAGNVRIGLPKEYPAPIVPTPIHGWAIRVGKAGYLNQSAHEDWTEEQVVKGVGEHTLVFTLTEITVEDKFTVVGKPGMKAACEEVKKHLGLWVHEPWYFTTSKEIPASGEVEFTTADGLVEGNHYAVYSSILPIPLVPWVYLDYEVYEFRGKRVITPGMGAVIDVMCGFFGIDIGTRECSAFVMEFADPIFVANTLSIITKHHNLITDRHQAPEKLDYFFFVLVLGGSASPLPIGKILKGFVGKLRKHGTVSETVMRWIGKHGDEMTEAGVYGDDVQLQRFTALVDEAMTYPEGSPDMLSSLNAAGLQLKSIIAKPGVSDDVALKIYGDWLVELNTRLNLANSVTSGDDVIRLSGLRATGKNLFKKVFDKLGNTRRGLKAHNAPVEIEGKLYDLASITVTEGRLGEQIARHLIPHTSGLLGWMGRHKLGVGIAAGWICVMGPWFSADNVCFIVYLLRRWGVIPEGWGTQWDDAVRRREDAFFALQDHPCVAYYQLQYTTAIDTMKTLLDGASPIPTDKIEKARYYISVVYGFHIGDPHEALREQMTTDFNAWTHRYFTLTQKCHDVVQPTWIIDLPKHPELLVNMKVDKVVDGDTMDVYGDGLEWPFGDTMRIRFLGIDTLEGSGDAYRIRRQTDFGGGLSPAIEKWWGDKDLYDDVKSWMTKHVKSEFVNLLSDENRPYDDYRRFLAVPIMVSDGKDIGEEELKLGYGPVRFYLPNKVVDATRQATYLAAEKIARDAKIGVWKFEEIPVDFGEIACKSSPTTAEIWVDGEKKDYTTPQTLKDIPVGVRTVTFKAPLKCIKSAEQCALIECSKRVTVTKGDRPEVSCNLCAIYEIHQPYYCKGRRCAKDTPETTIQPFIWIDGKEAKIDDNEIRARERTIIKFGNDIDGNPYIFGNYRGGIECGFGTHTIELKMIGHKTVKATEKIDPGDYFEITPEIPEGDETEEVEPTPTPVPDEPVVPTGTLHIGHAFAAFERQSDGSLKDGSGLQISTGANKFPLWVLIGGVECNCRCWIDEDLVFGDDQFCDNRSKPKLCPLPLGTHTFIVERKDYEDFEFTVTVNAGDEIDAPKINMVFNPFAAGATDMEESVIPGEIYLEREAVFEIKVLNTGSIPANYSTRMSFEGVDNPNVFLFESEISDAIAPGEKVSLPVPVWLPERAIPLDVSEAVYEISLVVTAYI